MNISKIKKITISIWRMIKEVIFSWSFLVVLPISIAIACFIPFEHCYPDPCYPSDVMCVQVVDCSITSFAGHLDRVGFHDRHTIPLFISFFSWLLITYILTSILFYLFRKLVNSLGGFREVFFVGFFKRLSFIIFLALFLPISSLLGGFTGSHLLPLEYLLVVIKSLFIIVLLFYILLAFPFYYVFRRGLFRWKILAVIFSLIISGSAIYTKATDSSFAFYKDSYLAWTISLLDDVDNFNVECIGSKYWGEQLQDGFYRARGKICYKGRLYYEMIDAESFEVFYPFYAKDVNNVYTFGYSKELSDNNVMIISNNPDSFSVVHIPVAKDKDQVFACGELIENADPETIENIGSTFSYFKDKNKAYWINNNGCTVEIISPNLDTYELVGDFYSRDKDSVFYCGKLLEGADSETFEYFDNGYAKDKHTVYKVSNSHDGCLLKILDEDPSTYEYNGNIKSNAIFRPY